MIPLYWLDAAERPARRPNPLPAAQWAVFLCPNVRVVFLTERRAAKAEVWLAHAMNPNPAT